MLARMTCHSLNFWPDVRTCAQEAVGLGFLFRDWNTETRMVYQRLIAALSHHTQASSVPSQLPHVLFFRQTGQTSDICTPGM